MRIVHNCLEFNQRNPKSHICEPIRSKYRCILNYRQTGILCGNFSMLQIFREYIEQPVGAYMGYRDGYGSTGLPLLSE